MVVSHTWSKFVSKHFLQESMLFLRDLLAAVDLDMQSHQRPADALSGACAARHVTTRMTSSQAARRTQTPPLLRQPVRRSPRHACGVMCNM